jgi:hypothetical protein
LANLPRLGRGLTDAGNCEEGDMSPRKRTIDDLDDVDDEDGVLEEEAAQETDLDLTVEDAEEALGLPAELGLESERDSDLDDDPDLDDEAEE